MDFPGDWFLKSLHKYYGRENELPIDAHGWYALIAPRPCLVYSPRRDREADHADVAACVRRAREMWRATSSDKHLTHQSPNDINRFQTDQHNGFLQWVKRQ